MSPHAEQRHIFANDWLCAGRADALKDPGDYLTMEIAGEPVILLRDRGGALRGPPHLRPPPTPPPPPGRARPVWAGAWRAAGPDSTVGRGARPIGAG